MAAITSTVRLSSAQGRVARTARRTVITAAARPTWYPGAQPVQ